MYVHVYPPSEINLKEQLVDQLEKAQKNLFAMKQQYEEKMTLLQQQIHQVESERDKVLKDMSQSTYMYVFVRVRFLKKHLYM